MSTGDIKNNLRKLKNELKKAHYAEVLDLENMVVGVTTAWLPVLHYLFAEYSVELTSYFSSKGYEFYGKSDLRFLEVVYKILIQEFGVKPMLTKEQFFTIGYAEVKVIFVTKIVTLCVKKNEEILLKIGKKKTRKNKITTKSNIVSNHVTNKGSDVQCIDLTSTEKTSNLNTVYDPRLKQQPTPPLPNPDLALTPMKSISKQVKSSNESNSKQFLCDDLLDVTELEPDDFSSSFVEIVEPEENQLPKFTITKHNDVDFKVVSSDNAPNHQLPEIEFSLPKYTGSPREMKVEPCHMKCFSCEADASLVDILTKRMENMEKNFYDLLTVNSELSARLILMETKVKMMESSLKEPQREKQELQKESEEESNKSQKNDEPILSVYKSEKKEYSPVKYTDDEVIIKGFKPIHLSDVCNLNADDALSYNKENIPVRHAEFAGDIGNDDNLNDFHDSILQDSLNVSHGFNANTKQTIHNVKQQLMETERLLQNGATHVTGKENIK